MVSGWFTATARITPGQLLIVISLMEYIINPVMSLENSMQAVRGLTVSLGRLDMLLFGEERAVHPAEDLPKPDVDRGIAFRNVSFSYTPERKVLDDLSFRMDRGQCWCILGANGAGKSTLIKLLGGVLKPDEGGITLCGRDGAALTGAERGRILSVMPQEPVVFSDTVLENIRLRREDISREAVVALCKRIGFHEDVMALPEGYDTELSEGAAPSPAGRSSGSPWSERCCGIRPL